MNAEDSPDGGRLSNRFARTQPMAYATSMTPSRRTPLFGIIVFLILAPSAISAPMATTAAKPFEAPLLYRPGDDPAWADPGLDESGWIEPPGRIADTAAGGGWYWLRTRLPAAAWEGESYLGLGRFYSAMEVYLDGDLIARLGSFPPSFRIQNNLSSVLLLPSAPGSSPEGRILAIRAYSDTPSQAIPPFSLLNRKKAEFTIVVENFLNSGLYFSLGWLCLMAGAIFLFQWLGRRADMDNFHFALASISIGVYFIEMGTLHPLLPLALNRAIAKSLLSLSIMSLVLFFRSHFRLKDRAWIKILCYANAALMTALFLWAGPRIDRMDMVFTLSLLPILGAMLYLLALVLRQLRRGDREAWTIFIGVILGVGFGCHDVIFVLAGSEPFAWLQGFGFFALNMSMFVSLSSRAARQALDLERSSVELERRGRDLSAHADRMRRAAREVEAISGEIALGIRSAASVSAGLESGSRMIRGSLGSYLELVRGVDTVVDKMLGSVSSMSTRIDDQATLAKEASDSLERFLAELESLSVYAESTMTFAGQLDGLSERGAASAGALARGMSSVKEALDDLGPVVDAVDDFAERSSLLAMNASIEAAHAGAVGRGFAVIAGEIKKLAAASSERARLIRATVHEAAERVAAQLEANRGVSDVLASVSASGSGASERIQATSRSVQALRASAEGLVRAMQELKDMTEELRRDSLAQAQGSASIRQDMSGMAGRTRDVEGLIDAIEEGNRSLIGAVKRLESVAGGGERALSELHAALSPDAS